MHDSFTSLLFLIPTTLDPFETMTASDTFSLSWGTAFQSLATLGTGGLIVLSVLGFVAVVTLFGMWMGWQKIKGQQELTREAMRMAVENNQPLPPELVGGEGVPLTAEQIRHQREVRQHLELLIGLTLVATGGGLWFMVPVIAPLVGFLGLAGLACYAVDVIRHPIG